jgi:hypothetical protein
MIEIFASSVQNLLISVAGQAAAIVHEGAQWDGIRWPWMNLRTD